MMRCGNLVACFTFCSISFLWDDDDNGDVDEANAESCALARECGGGDGDYAIDTSTFFSWPRLTLHKGNSTR